MRRAIKKLVEQLTRKHIFRVLPGGVDLFHDLRTYLPRYRAEVVFDIGANVGQSVTSYVHHFDRAKIFCFEPVSISFSTLKNAFADHPNVHCFKMALSSRKGVGRILMEGSSDMYRIADSTVHSDARTEDIEMDTLDEFCIQQHIPRISLVKIDTEGHDLEVLKGSEGMLKAAMIDIIQVEAGMNRNNTRHVHFEALKEYLESRAYFLFRIYEQVPEWPTGEPHLRRSNPVFISRNIIEMNRR
jgi:FkbM family methyltransferase